MESGSITIAGRKVDYKSSADAVKDGIGFISGNRNRESIFNLRTIGKIYSVQKCRWGEIFPISNRMIIQQANQIVQKYDIKIAN